MRRFPLWAAVAAAGVVGGGIGAAVAAAGDTSYKAEAKVVVQANGGATVVRPLLPNLRELAQSSLLAGNVDSTLRLPGSPDSLRKRLHASIAPGSQVIVLSVVDRKRDRARQIDQEAAVVFSDLVPARFRTPPLTATILDPASVVDFRGRHFVRDPLIGAALGLVLALAALVTKRRGLTLAPTDERLAEREQQLKQRIEVLAQRERALVRRAGELAERERALQAREAEARTVEAPPVVVAAELRPEPELEPEPEPEPAIVAPPSEPPRTAVGTTALLNINELERLVEAHGEAPPDAVDEWRTYLFFLRDHASADGGLPATFASLVDDVFGDILTRRS